MNRILTDNVPSETGDDSETGTWLSPGREPDVYLEKKPITRRTFLRGVGAAVALPFLGGYPAMMSERMPAASVQVVRHATLRIAYGDTVVLVDPMLAEPGAYPPVIDSPNQRRNPLVPLPISLDEVLADVGFVLVTHTHPDHWDEAAVEAVPRDVAVYGQPAAAEKIKEAGFSRTHAVADTASVGRITLTRTGGRHGSGILGSLLGPVSGFVLQQPGLPTIYLAGDTMWGPEVQDALSRHNPDVIILNSGAAQFNIGSPITMTADDVAAVVRAASEARVIVVHMEAWNHCLLRRDRLRDALQQAGVARRVAIPDDGETIVFG